LGRKRQNPPLVKALLRTHAQNAEQVAGEYIRRCHELPQGIGRSENRRSGSGQQQLKATPADYFGEPVMIRQTGRVAYDLNVYEVKKPEESKYAWDYYKPVRKVSAEEAFGPDVPGECALK
jgi:hypothetical protein